MTEPVRGGRLEAMREYVEALGEGDLDRVLALFAPRARVVSPLEGPRGARAFYSGLFEVTKTSRVRLLHALLGEDGVTSAAHLSYDWTLKDGTRNRFEVVDLFRFNEDGLIKELKIFYDPAEIRPEYERVQRSG